MLNFDYDIYNTLGGMLNARRKFVDKMHGYWVFEGSLNIIKTLLLTVWIFFVFFFIVENETEN